MYKQGFSLSEISVSMAILFILVSLSIIAYFIFIDNANINRMKANAETLEAAVLFYYDDFGTLPKKDMVPLNDNIKYLINNVTGGKCTNNIKGTVVTRPGKEILSNGKIYSGSYEYDLEEVEVADDFVVYAYDIDLNELDRYVNNNTSKEDLKDFVILDCLNKVEQDNDELNNDNDNDNKKEDPNCDVIYYCIYNEYDFYNIRNDLKGHYVLMNDIDLSTFSNWSPLGTIDDYSEIEQHFNDAINYILYAFNLTLAEFLEMREVEKEALINFALKQLGVVMYEEFEGILDGRGYEIIGPTMNDINYNGLIGIFHMVNNAVIKDIKIKDMYVNINSFKKDNENLFPVPYLQGGSLSFIIQNSTLENVSVAGKVRLNINNVEGIEEVRIGGLAVAVENVYMNNVNVHVDYETSMICDLGSEQSQIRNLFNKFIMLYHGENDIVNSDGFGERKTYNWCL